MIGLMAKHLSEGRTFPLFTYGQNYNLAFEAWMAAPLFWLAGPSVAMLKLPLLALNIAIVVLLIVYLEKDLQLRPALGFVAASFFILAPPGTSTYFLEASGVNIEPFFVVLLLWITRRRPLVFGMILGFGRLRVGGVAADRGGRWVALLASHVAAQARGVDFVRCRVAPCPVRQAVLARAGARYDAGHPRRRGGVWGCNSPGLLTDSASASAMLKISSRSEA